MEYSTYIIYCAHLDRYYVGHCQDIDERLRRRNDGDGSTYTKKAKDWLLKWTEGFETCKEAASRKSAIKTSYTTSGTNPHTTSKRQY